MILNIISHSAYRILLLFLHLHIYAFHPTLALLDLFYFAEEFISSVYGRFRALFKRSHEDDEATYGSFTFYSLFQLKLLLTIDESVSICDFGSGKGKLCLFFALMCKSNCTGIEKNANYNRMTRFLIALFSQQSRIEIIEGDFLDLPLVDAALYFIPATCLEDETLERLAKKIEASDASPVIVSSSAPLDIQGYKIHKVFRCTQSWGFSTIYVQVSK